MTPAERLAQAHNVFKWAFLLSLPLLAAVHAPMLPSEALPHRAYHAAQSALGPAFHAVVIAGFVTPCVSLIGIVVTTAIARRT